MSKWINTKDNMPALYQEVMFLFEMYGMNGEIIKKDIVCGHHEKTGWNVCYHYVSIPLTNDDTKLKVTHWMLLPEPPETK